MDVKVDTSNSKPLINPQPPADKAEMVSELLGKIEESLGFVPDPLRLYGISPPLLQSFLGYISYFRSGESGISESLAALIRYLVSTSAECRFCVDFNEAMLLKMGFDFDALRNAKKDPSKSPVTPKEQCLVDLAVKSVDDPEAVTAHDLDQARKAGWTDRDLFDCVALASNNRALNLVLKTFKVHRMGAFD